MRRRILALSAVLVAAGVVSSISLFLLSGASPAGAQDSDGSVSQGSIYEGPGLADETFPPYSQVVDDADPERFSAPGWESRSTNPDGYKGDYHVAGGTEPAQFKVEIPATDVYSVYAWWPTAADNGAAASFDITTTSGVQRTVVNQQEDGGMWVKLGSYEMAAGDSYAVQVSPESGSGGRVVADAVAVVRGVLSPPPEDGTIDVAGGKPTGRDVVRVARRYLGTDYKWGTCTNDQMSCACLTKKVYAKFGQKLPFSEDKQWKYGKRVSKPRPGNLVFFEEKGRKGGITHVGIYSGNGELVHASAYFDKVVESKMKYIDGYKGARKLRLK
jgi:cell wall-associated NlpC family hydrolase